MNKKNDKERSEEIEKTIIRIISKHLCIEDHYVGMDSSLSSLGADSLDTIEIIMRLEEKFDIAINDEDIISIKNVKGIIDYCNLLISNKNP